MIQIPTKVVRVCSDFQNLVHKARFPGKGWNLVERIPEVVSKSVQSARVRRELLGTFIRHVPIYCKADKSENQHHIAVTTWDSRSAHFFRDTPRNFPLPSFH